MSVIRHRSIRSRRHTIPAGVRQLLAPIGGRNGKPRGLSDVKTSSVFRSATHVIASALARTGLHLHLLSRELTAQDVRWRSGKWLVPFAALSAG